jgi:DME family drug/metabolite transporter
VVFLVFSGLLWGTGGLTGRLLAQSSHLSPLAVAAYRLTVGGALIVAYLAVRHRGKDRSKPIKFPRNHPRSRPAYRRTLTVGLLAAAFQATYFAAVTLTSVSLATLVTIGTAPVLVVAAETATGRHRLTPAKALTTALALTGLVLLVGTVPSGIGTAALAGGVACAVVAAVGFATITLVCATPVDGLDELTMTGYGFLLGGLVLAAVTVATGSPGALRFDPGAHSLALVALLGLGPTAIAYTAFFTGLRTAPASTAAVTALLEPLTGTVLAALVLGDRIGAPGLAGAALLAVSVLCALRTGKAGDSA